MDKTSFLVAFVQSFGEASDDTKKEGTTNKKGGGAVFLGRIIKSPQLGEQNK